MHTESSTSGDGECPTKVADSASLHDEEEDNSNIENMKPLQEFGLFSELRPEIRIQIWKHAAMNQESQILEIYPCRHTSKHKMCELYLHEWMPNFSSPNGCYHIQYQQGLKASLLALASTSLESRTEMQRYVGTLTCRPINRDSIPEMVYYNLELDTVAICYRDLEMWRRGETWGVHGLSQIKKLLILHRCCLCGPHSLKPDALSLSCFLAQFTSLKELYIEFDTTYPKTGIIKSINLTEPNEDPGSSAGERRKAFEGKKQRLLEDRRQCGGSVIEVMELVTCERVREEIKH